MAASVMNAAFLCTLHNGRSVRLICPREIAAGDAA